MLLSILVPRVTLFSNFARWVVFLEITFGLHNLSFTCQVWQGAAFERQSEANDPFCNGSRKNTRFRQRDQPFIWTLKWWGVGWWVGLRDCNAFEAEYKELRRKWSPNGNLLLNSVWKICLFYARRLVKLLELKTFVNHTKEDRHCRQQRHLTFWK